MMPMIRLATAEDIEQLAEFGGRFFASSGYGKLLPYVGQDMVQALYAILDAGVIYVAEDEGKLVGGILGVMSCLWCQPSVQLAAELGWWMTEEFRKSPISIRLLKEFEAWAQRQGAKLVVMSDMVMDGEYRVGDMLNRLGYQTTERAHMKVL